MKISPDRIYSFILPGQVKDARMGLEEAVAAERHGLGGIFLSERWESKELGVMMGALTQVTRTVRLVAGLTHFGTRHPLVQAGMAQTLQTLSGNRFVLGYGRGVPSEFRKLGIPTPNMQGIADHAAILRALWAGETVRYSGPAGNYPEMQLPYGCESPPPILIGTTGPKTLALAGRCFDGVVLHPFLTVEGVARSLRIVREAAVEAHRDPNKIKIYATVVTVPDTLPPELRADALEARAVSYFMHREVGMPIVQANGWSAAPLIRLLESGLSQVEYGAGEPAKKRRRMAEAARLLPPEWLMEGAASGSTAQCVKRLLQYFAAGADYILLHGTRPQQQIDIIDGLKKANA